MVEWKCNKEAVRRVIISKKANKNNIAFIHFYNVSDKQMLIDFIQSKKKDADGKYIQILNEHIFKLQDDDTSRPNQVDFNTPMTEHTRAIFNKARSMNKDGTIGSCFLSDGVIMIKMGNDSKTISIYTVSQLEGITKSTPMAMETT